MSDRDYGQVVCWNDAGGGYGFVRPDNRNFDRDVFFHVSELNGQEIRIGDRVTYELGTGGRNQQTCAKRIRINGETK